MFRTWRRVELVGIWDMAAGGVGRCLGQELSFLYFCTHPSQNSDMCLHSHGCCLNDQCTQDV